MDATSVWLCRETGLLPSQYDTAAVNHMIQGIVSMLKSHTQLRSPCVVSPTGTSLGMRVSIPSSVLREISELCLPIVHLEAALPVVKCLLECKFHSVDLSPSFLERLTQLQSTLTLDYETELALWTTYLPSFKQKLLRVMADLQNLPVSNDQDEKDNVLSLLTLSNLPKACLERAQLFVYAEEFLQSYATLDSSVSSLRFGIFIAIFNKMFVEQYNAMTIRPAGCPQFCIDYHHTSTQQ